MNNDIESSIEFKIKQIFLPIFFKVTNESYMHKGPSQAETHFKLVIVSEKFKGKPLLARHRMVYELLEEELNEKGVHALALHTYEPSQWGGEAPASPNCRGGA